MATSPEEALDYLFKQIEEQTIQDMPKAEADHDDGHHEDAEFTNENLPCCQHCKG